MIKVWDSPSEIEKEEFYNLMRIEINNSFGKHLNIVLIVYKDRQSFDYVETEGLI